MNTKVAIVVFKLQRGHYYVECNTAQHGYTRDDTILEDMMVHRNALLHDYPIVRIHKVYHCPYTWMDSIIVKRYMARYGINNVRGGVYYKCQLDQVIYSTLQRELYNVPTMGDNDGYDNHTHPSQFHVVKNKNWFGMLVRRIIKPSRC